MGAGAWCFRSGWIVSLAIFAASQGCGGVERAYQGDGGAGGAGTAGSSVGTGGSGTGTGGRGTGTGGSGTGTGGSSTGTGGSSTGTGGSGTGSGGGDAGTGGSGTGTGGSDVGTGGNGTGTGGSDAGTGGVAGDAGTDATAPTIRSTTPANGAMGVPIATTISVDFSEPMVQGSVQLTVEPPVTLGSGVWNSGGTSVAFTPSAPLAAATTYNVTVVAGSDLAGNALSGPSTFSFTTAAPPDMTPPTVASVVPANGATGVANNSSIIITFSEAMARAATAMAIGVSPAVTCTGGWTWNMGGTAATCVPSGDLPSTTLYTVSVGTGARDLAGNAMTAPFSSSFTTGVAPDRTPPTIVSTIPASNTTGVLRAASIVVNFSEPMDVMSSQAAFSVTSPAGVTGTFTWTNTNKTMTFRPMSTFAYGDLVKFQVTNGAQDAAGNAKATTDVYQFTVIKSATVNLACIDALDGGVNSLMVAYPGNSVTAGDSGAGGTFRGFEAFDMTAIPATATTITAASIFFNQYQLYDMPYGATSLGDLNWNHVDFGPTLEGTDYATPLLVHSYNTGILSSSATLGWKSDSVLFAVLNDWNNRAARGNRSEYVLRFTRDDNNDMTADYAYLYPCGSANATVRPYLAVTYEYP